MSLDILRTVCPFPTISDDGTLHDGLLIAQPSRCRKCPHQNCRLLLALDPIQAIQYGVCEKGLSVVTVRLHDCLIRLNGVVVTHHNEVISSTERKLFRPQKATLEQVSAWRDSVIKALPQLETAIMRVGIDTVGGLHDIQTATNLVFRNVEALTYDIAGETDAEKIDNAPPELRELMQSAALLRSRLQMMALLGNP